MVSLPYIVTTSSYSQSPRSVHDYRHFMRSPTYCVFYSRSYKGFEEWLYYLTYITHTRYASIFMHRNVFKQPSFNILPYSDQENCTSTISSLLQTSSNSNTNSNANCRYASGKAFLTERFTSKSFNGDLYTAGDFNPEFNLGVSFAFSLGIMVFNKFLYLMPLPGYITDKFRE